MALFLLFVCSCAAITAFWHLSRRKKRQTLLETPLTARQHDIILHEVPLIRRVPPQLGARLDGKISLFLDQVDFIGCDGLEITEEMTLSIAAQACLLVVNTDAWYDTLRTILIYPGAFKSKRVDYNGYVATERETVRLGESWARGPVILSWQHSDQGAADSRDGHNVVIHEFAHQLDNLTGETNGIPILAEDQSFADWARVFSDGFDRHLTRVEQGKDTVIDAYGAEGHEEYFATALEVFFERPSQLKQDEPEVYAELTKLLRLDPATW